MSDEMVSIGHETVGQPSSDLSDAQVNELLSDGEGNAEIPMSNQPQPQKFKFQAGGKDIEASQEELIKWAQMGYNYPQQKAEFNKQIEAFKAQQAEFEQRQKQFTPFMEIDKYARENPQWWEMVSNEYAKAQQGITQETSPEIAALKEEIAELRKFRDELQSEKSAQQLEKEDKELAGEVESIRKSYPNIDFDTPDESGANLEMRVLKHAMDNNIASFKVAFRDYYHDQLVAKAEIKGKETLSQELGQKSKLGILSETSKPTRGFQDATNVKSKSYEDLMREGIEEALAGAI